MVRASTPRSCRFVARPQRNSWNLLQAIFAWSSAGRIWSFNRSFILRGAPFLVSNMIPVSGFPRRSRCWSSKPGSGEITGTLAFEFIFPV
jgi:hypothetical protein